MQTHADKVARIARALAAHDAARPVTFVKHGVPHQVPKGGDLRRTDDKIDISDLTEILEIDPIARTCTAESGVAFVDLVRATLEHDLLPVVVPELKTITVGGAVAGGALESMSFRRGGFHDTCRAIEVIATTGKILECTRDNEHRLVFDMIHGTFGTLGVIASVTFDLVPAKPFVRVNYETFHTVDAYRRAIAARAEDPTIDFMDGIIHAPDRCVLSLGRFVDSAPYTTRYDWMRVYYRSTATHTEDYLTTEDYVFRYDRGVTNVRPKSWLGRLAFGKVMTSTNWLRLGEALHRFLDDQHPTVTLDVFVPISRATEFLAWYERAIGYFPLWCVPYRRVHDYPWLTPKFWQGVGDDAMFLDLAIYGLHQPPLLNYYRMIEEELPKVGGMKTLISHNYYSESEFWTTWNRATYAAAKAITDPAGKLRDFYDATCRAAMGKR